MNVVILAREGSERYAGKHLHPINGEPMLTGIIKRLQGIGANVILATGKLVNNRNIVNCTLQAGGDFYCEEEEEEWDLVSRMLNMSKELGLDRWVQYSGDCPFVDLRSIKLIWFHLENTDYDRVSIVSPHAGISVGMGDRIAGGDTVRFWQAMDRCVPRGDKRREQAWVHTPDTEYTTFKIPVPWTDIAATPVKTSVDWPFEGAIADLVVRTLGRWPETDQDVLSVYRKVYSIVDAGETK